MNSDDSPQDQLMSYGEMHGWRLEVWKSGFWLDTYEYRIRPVPKSGDSPDADPTFFGCAYRSVDDAKAACLETFKENMRLGHLKPIVV
ncbi:hypothetical protein [Xanthomonas campestris]|uniref:hypothetical protein n=1 Tax=Xanthomonas campestris TaxID=339 RepID=UPI0021F706D2|nr:hypothetical protein [Xanthomonas campestris]MEB1944069.1 hypothetical protein [Xanthomonas campestris pv. campestris]UYP80195.1 hypothetical protein OF401_22105 [Xanthomonas campestris pv. campestris]